MLRQDTAAISPDSDGTAINSGVTANTVAYREPARVGSVDILRELNKLEEMIFDSPRIPLTRCTLVDEEQLFYQLDLVRRSLPTAFQEATEVMRHKEEILSEAEQYAQEIIEAAERRAAQILDETNLMRQAEMEAQQVRQRLQQDCEAAQERTLVEIERVRRQAQQEIDEMRQLAMSECQEIQSGADAYADRVLRDMEQQFTEMIRIIRNGRQQLNTDPAQPKVRDESTPGRSQPPTRLQERRK